MKTLMTIFFMVLLTRVSYASDKGNGGGGIVRGERYMTFHTAGFLTRAFESEIDEVPQLQSLIDFFDKHQAMSIKNKMEYIGAMVPSNSRKYFEVKEDKFSDEVHDSLMAEFSRVTGANTTELAIFAITDTTSGSTYLLPSFFKLSENDQMAILFHEAYWILNPTASYNEVVEAEMYFQAYLENPDSVKKLTSFISKIGTSSDYLRTLIKYDLQHKTMHGLVKDNKILMSDLLGKNFDNCRQTYGSLECNDLAISNIYDLTKKYEDSAFLKFLFNKISEGKVSVSPYNYHTGYNGKYMTFNKTIRSFPYLNKCYLTKNDSIDLLNDLSRVDSTFFDVIKRRESGSRWRDEEHCISQQLIIEE